MFAKLVRFIRNSLVVLWWLVVFIVGAWIAYYNTSDITVNLIGFDLPVFSVGTYLCVFFSLGVAIGWLGTWLMVRAKLFSRQRELGKAKKEVQKLRTTQALES